MERRLMGGIFGDYGTESSGSINGSSAVSYVNPRRLDENQARIAMENSFGRLSIRSTTASRPVQNNLVNNLIGVITVIILARQSTSTSRENHGIFYIGKGCYGVDIETASRFPLTPAELIDVRYWTDLRPEVTSRKVFVGGIPKKYTSSNIKTAFTAFGPATISWPTEGGEARKGPMKGFVFVIYKSADSVNNLLNDCILIGSKFFFYLQVAGRMPTLVQVRPWFLADQLAISDDPTRKVNFRRIAFFGGIPRSMKASELAECTEREIPGVVLVNIETDPHLDYPKGAAKVAFANDQSFREALRRRFLKVHYEEVLKVVEMKPFFLPEQNCNLCEENSAYVNLATQYCVEKSCVNFYCDDCWNRWHSNPEVADHIPLSK
ncbi:RNA binding protein orb2 [Trichuris trichiura]|uniref:RNA binding protein orb2 n=1 Tax=Trichuris trichiura TaxID=36087 RepID=A0A077Z751_TRITR|nr:RNA binding protein orb2 [Trichuris trichiura]